VAIAFEALKRRLEALPFRPFAIDPPLDPKGHFEPELDPELPLDVKLHVFSRPQAPSMWHRFLELFVPIEGECIFRMGEADVHVRAGDALAVDHLKMHVVRDVPSAEARVLVLRFMPELVGGLGAPGAADLYLLPFLCHLEGEPNVMRAGAAASEPVHAALAEVVASFFAPRPNPYRVTGVRAHFLLLLHHLAQHFGAHERLRAEHFQHRHRRERLRRLFEFIEQHHDEKISVDRAARLVGVSRPQLTRLFRQATGTSLVEYLTKVRLSHAARLLRESNDPIADIAMRVGFEDPSYFDRRFRAFFGATPLRYRAAAATGAG
jgi:AraC-like DNA-binding protein